MKIARFNLIFALCLMAYEVQAEDIHPEYDITTTTIVVNWYDSEAELHAALPGQGNIAGLSDCEYRPEFNVSFCELWLVRPTEATEFTDTIEQEKWKTVGEEFVHALWGEFHE